MEISLIKICPIFFLWDERCLPGRLDEMPSLSSIHSTRPKTIAGEGLAQSSSDVLASVRRPLPFFLFFLPPRAFASCPTPRPCHRSMPCKRKEQYWRPLAGEGAMWRPKRKEQYWQPLAREGAHHDLAALSLSHTDSFHPPPDEPTCSLFHMYPHMRIHAKWQHLPPAVPLVAMCLVAVCWRCCTVNRRQVPCMHHPSVCIS